MLSLVLTFGGLKANEAKKEQISSINNVICSCRQMENYLIDLIDEEKARGRIGGFVNKKRIYGLSDKVLMARKVKKAQINKLVNLGAKQDISKCKKSININRLNDIMMRCMVAYMDMLDKMRGLK